MKVRELKRILEYADDGMEVFSEISFSSGRVYVHDIDGARKDSEKGVFLFFEERPSYEVEISQ